jgi:hypothetical protein
LIQHFHRLCQSALTGYQREVAERIEQHLLSQMICLGKHRITTLVATSGGQFEDWTADYRLYSKARIDPHRLFDTACREVLNALADEAPLVVAVDDTRLRKSSLKTPGVKYTLDPLGPKFHLNFILAQRFLQLSAMQSVGPEGDAMAVPIAFHHAPTPNKPGKKATEQERQNYRDACKISALPRRAVEQVCLLRQRMNQDGQRKRPLWSAVDGGYTNRTFMKKIPENSLGIGRIRSDAKLYYLPEHQPDTGRRRVYGEPAPTPEALRTDDGVPWQTCSAFAAGKCHDFKIKTIGPVRWRSTGKVHNLRVIVIAPLHYRLRKGARFLYRKPAFLICTDPDQPIQDILQAYLWRWKIEVNFRDEKTIFGVGDAQVRHPESVERVPATAVAAYALLLLAGQAASSDTTSIRLPPPKWNPTLADRITTQQLVNTMRAQAWGLGMSLNDFVDGHSPNAKPFKLLPPIESAVLYGANFG